METVTEEQPKKLRDYSLDELKALYAELTKGQRQHGKRGEACTDEEAEWKRLYKNIASIKSRNNRKKVEKRQDEAFEDTYCIGHKDADKYGILPRQERMYKQIFRNCSKGSRVHRDYAIRMTGLTLYQLYILQQRTGLISVPAVKETEALKDKKYREDNAIYI